MANLYPFKSGLGLVEPFALAGENVCIVYGTLPLSQDSMV